MKLRQFFTESNDRLSMMRLCTFILVTGGLTLCFVYPTEPVGEIVIALGLGAKWGQKKIETKKHENTNTDTVNP
jgi:hypothetical protein